jgi:hypothetical protein
MLCREIIAVCSEIHTKHINTLCGQKVEYVDIKPGFRYPLAYKRLLIIFHYRIFFKKKSALETPVWNDKWRKNH